MKCWKKEEEVLAEMEENDGVQAEMAEEYVGRSDRGMWAEMSANRDVPVSVNLIESTPVSRKRRIPSKANAAKTKVKPVCSYTMFLCAYKVVYVGT